jgi:TRAP-type uncharacterized transport system fused permease subunit
VLADATPPVAAAAFAAASIAGAPPTLTSLHATRFGIAGFTVGFAFVYDPGIMLRGGLVEILLASAVQVGALVAVTAAYAGYLSAPLGPVARVLLGAAGLAAAFLHLLPASVRLAVAVGAVAIVWAAGRAARGDARRLESSGVKE